MASLEVNETSSKNEKQPNGAMNSTMSSSDDGEREGTTASDSNEMMGNEDTLLFGSRNSVIADEFCDRIDEALVAGVASLPHIPQEDDASGESHSDKLLKKLRKAYYRSVDISELYAARNIFTISNRTPYFRKRVVAAFLSQEEGGKNTASTSKGDNTPAAAAKAQAMPQTLHSFPANKEEVPTQEAFGEMERKLHDLRLKLRETRTHKMERLRYWKDLEQAEEFSKDVTQTIENNKGLEEVHESVQAFVEGKEELEVLQKEGKELVEKMDNNKRERVNDENENNNKLPIVERKRTKVALEEDYQKRLTVLAQTQEQDLAKVKGMLQRK